MWWYILTLSSVVIFALPDISEIGRSAKSFCEHTARTQPTLSDIVVTLVEMGECQDYMVQAWQLRRGQKGLCMCSHLADTAITPTVDVPLIGCLIHWAWKMGCHPLGIFGKDTRVLLPNPFSCYWSSMSPLCAAESSIHPPPHLPPYCGWRTSIRPIRCFRHSFIHLNIYSSKPICYSVWIPLESEKGEGRANAGELIDTSLPT